MIKRLSLNLLCLGALCAPLAAQAPNLETLFPRQAVVEATPGELSRLPLPLEVLSQCRADLSDLRIYDSDRAEVPYLVSSGPRRETELTRSYALAPSDVDQQTIRRENQPRLYRESYLLPLPPDGDAAQAWDLVVAAGATKFVREITVEGQRQSLPVETLVDRGSVFRLTDPLREKLRVTLPEFAGESLLVTIEGTDARYLSPTFSIETSRSFAAGGQASLELEILSQTERESETVVKLERPRGVVPHSLVLGTTTPNFERRVRVTDGGSGSDAAELADGTLFRVEGVAEAPFGEDRLALSRAKGDRLLVVIENGDSPPLAELKFEAVLFGPSLVFSLTGRGPGILRFGGARVDRPAYDLQRLAGLLTPPEQGERAEIAERLLTLPVVGLGEIEENPDFVLAPILEFAMRPGSEVDSRFYRHKLTIGAPASENGLVRVLLGLETLAKAQPDLADLRVLDLESRQWAYLIEPDSEHLTRGLPVARETSEESETRYELMLPAAPPVKIDELIVRSNVPFFDREYRLVAEVDGSEVELSRGRLQRRRGDRSPIRLRFRGTRIDQLTLVVADGDDAPLALSVDGRFPVSQLYFAAPAGEYALLIGNDEAEAPSYELAQVRDVVLGVTSADAVQGGLAPNPEYSARARLVTESGTQQVFLWGAMILAVGFLGFMTLRLARAG